MAYKALYRTYRPLSFSEVVGQKYIVTTLKNSIKKDRIAHAYLFCGPRGTGKTTFARIFAKAINCENYDEEPCNACENCIAINEGTHPDVVEIDAASNNRVEEARELIEKVKYAPFQSKYKVYIIDEVHMLTQGAFNALLKTLEEPPAHVVFILATTEPHKVLPTITSRCQRFDFGKLSETDIYRRLQIVCQDCDINCEEDALHLIARLSDGGMRDALSILDQCVSYAANNITMKDVSEIYGLVSSKELISLLDFIIKKNVDSLLKQAKDFFERGVDIKRLTSDLMEVCKEALIYSYVKNEELLLKLNINEVDLLLNEYRSKDLVAVIDLLLDTLEKYRFSTNVNTYFEVMLIKATELFNQSSNQETEIKKPLETSSIIHNVDELKNKLKSMAIDVSRETITTEEVKKQVSENIKEVEDVEVDYEMLLEMLVSANKVQKEKDLALWQQLNKYQFDIKYAKYANLLKMADIIAASEDSLILSVANKSVANEINLISDTEMMMELLCNILGNDRFLVALSVDESKELIRLFKERRQNGTLPTARSFVKEKVEDEKKEEKQQTPEEKIIQLFGAGNVEIREN